jgi:hypothetical protein
VQPGSLVDRAAMARIERVIEPAQPELTKFDRLRIDKWIRDRLVAAWTGGCWHCRRPIVVGQKFVDVRGNEVVVRFHAQCESEWRLRQEALAREALGLRDETSR